MILKTKKNTLQQVFIDHKGRLWVTGNTSGLSLYHPATDDFTDYRQNPFLPQ
jgi:ligand-binding sensor domain-containing protein